MKLSYSAFLVAATAAMVPLMVHSFSPLIAMPSSRHTAATTATNNGVFVSSASTTLFMSENDSDWFDDYDPSVYEKENSDDRRSSNRGGGGAQVANRGRHGYSRDTSRDSSNVDMDAVNALIEERNNARRSRDFDTADSIRDELMTVHSVGIDDREMTWRTGCSSSGSGMKFGGGGRGGAPQRGRGGPRRDRDFGPNGHDYILCEDAGPITSSFTEPEIHSLLAERLQAKMNRNFDVADKIQRDLINADVYVHDGMKEWRADGIPFGDMSSGNERGGPGRNRGSRNDRNRAYERSIHSVDVDGVEDSLIDALVNERAKCKMLRQYDKADAIREGLRTKYNVIIDDRIRAWSVNGDFGEEHNAQREIANAFGNRGYIKSASSMEVSQEDEEYIQSKIEERVECKKNRDFETADIIRDELKDTYNVFIKDKLKMWSVGGDFAAEGGGTRTAFGVYIRRGGGTISEEDIAEVNNLILQRAEAKRERNYDVADEIRDTLQKRYQIRLDDKAREWRIDSEETRGIYTRAHDDVMNGDLSEEDLEHIATLIKERSNAKKERDFVVADGIRDTLSNKYNVKLNDRTSEWCIDPSDDGSYSP